jgi:4-alpha-glucanotransferase
MKFHFFIRCSTKWGEELFLGIRNQQVETSEMVMQYLDEDFWHAEINLEMANATSAFTYQYKKKTVDGLFQYDGEKKRVLQEHPESRKQVTLIDEWTDAGAPVHIFYTQPFSVLTGVDKSDTAQTREQLNKHETICITGNTEKLRNWNSVRPLLMRIENGWYTLRLKLPVTEERILYKYGIYNTRKKEFVAFESGENRFVPFKRLAKETQFINDSAVRFPIANWKGAGVAIPVFSLLIFHCFANGQKNVASN